MARPKKIREEVQPELGDAPLPNIPSSTPRKGLRLKATKFDIVDPTTSIRIPVRESVPVQAISKWLQRQIDIKLVEVVEH